MDRQFNELRTRSQSGFAQQQIAYDQQRAKDAATVGQALAQAQQAMASNDEGRLLQAINLMGSIPQYADRRLQLAQGALQPLNSQTLLALLSQLQGQNATANAYGNQQNQSWWGGIGALLAGLF